MIVATRDRRRTGSVATGWLPDTAHVTSFPNLPTMTAIIALMKPMSDAATSDVDKIAVLSLSARKKPAFRSKHLTLFRSFRRLLGEGSGTLLCCLSSLLIEQGLLQINSWKRKSFQYHFDPSTPTGESLPTQHEALSCSSSNMSLLNKS